jgi:site-specific recombinase XerD
MARKAAQVEGVYERKVGSGRWYARYWQDGKKVRKSFGRDRSAAVAYLEKARTLQRTGEGVVPTTAKKPILTSAEMAAVQDGTPLGDLCDGLLQHIIDNPKQYRDQRNPPLRINRIKKKFGSRAAASIRPYEIADWLEGLKVSAATSNRFKTQFSSIYVYGKRRDKISVNPVRDVKQQKVTTKLIRWLDDEEEVRLRKVLQEDIDACGPRNDRLRNRRLHHVYELDVALGTGMRRSEQYHLDWPDIDFGRREIPLDLTKHGDGRVVHLNDDVVAALRSLQKIPMVRKSRSADKPNKAPDTAVFSLGDPRKWFVSAIRRAKIKKFRWHDLRHTFCSRLAQKGISLKIIQEAAGHKSIATTAKYAHLDKKTLVEALALLNRDAG